jgi:competence protein ComEC
MSKTTKRFFLGVLIVCGAIVFSLPYWPDNRLHLVFCDVGQGDAVLVKHRDWQAVVDGGPSGERLLSCLSAHIPPWDRKIELVVVTHPEADHITGLVDVLERYDVNQIVVNSLTKESGVFREFRRLILAEGAEVYSPQAGDEIRLGEVSFLILWPEKRLGDSRIWESAASNEQEAQILGAAEYDGDVNETSVVLGLSYGNFDALLTGDIGFVSENQLDFPEVEVLKIPHHGSRYSTSLELLQESSSELAVISVGKNSFGHPTEEVLGKLEGLGIEVLRTDQAGEIEIVADGRSWQVLD